MKRAATVDAQAALALVRVGRTISMPSRVGVLRDLVGLVLGRVLLMLGRHAHVLRRPASIAEPPAFGGSTLLHSLARSSLRFPARGRLQASARMMKQEVPGMSCTETTETFGPKPERLFRSPARPASARPFQRPSLTPCGGFWRITGRGEAGAKLVHAGRACCEQSVSGPEPPSASIGLADVPFAPPCWRRFSCDGRPGQVDPQSAFSQRPGTGFATCSSYLGAIRLLLTS